MVRTRHLRVGRVLEVVAAFALAAITLV